MSAILTHTITPKNFERMRAEMGLAWRRAVRRWRGAGEIVWLDETRFILVDAVCTWAGLPLKQAKVRARARDLVKIVRDSDASGPRSIAGKIAQARTEHWLMWVLSRVRRGKLQVHRHTPLWLLAKHRDSSGRPVDLHEAAAALTGVLRQAVAAAPEVAAVASALNEGRTFPTSYFGLRAPYASLTQIAELVSAEYASPLPARLPQFVPLERSL